MNKASNLIAVMGLVTALSGSSGYGSLFDDLPKHPRTFHSQGYVKCCSCGTCSGTMYKHGDDEYICRACKLKEKAAAKETQNEQC